LHLQTSRYSKHFQQIESTPAINLIAKEVFEEPGGPHKQKLRQMGIPPARIKSTGKIPDGIRGASANVPPPTTTVCAP
jgi:hypothetical protein